MGSGSDMDFLGEGLMESLRLTHGKLFSKLCSSPLNRRRGWESATRNIWPPLWGSGFTCVFWHKLPARLPQGRFYFKETPWPRHGISTISWTLQCGACELKWHCTKQTRKVWEDTLKSGILRWTCRLIHSLGALPRCATTNNCTPDRGEYLVMKKACKKWTTSGRASKAPDFTRGEKW